MTLMAKHEALDRIKATDQAHPLAVFTMDAEGKRKEGEVDVIFADTVSAYRRIKAGWGYLGNYHSRNYAELCTTLRDMEQEDAA